MKWNELVTATAAVATSPSHQSGGSGVDISGTGGGTTDESPLSTELVPSPTSPPASKVPMTQGAQDSNKNRLLKPRTRVSSVPRNLDKTDTNNSTNNSSRRKTSLGGSSGKQALSLRKVGTSSKALITTDDRKSFRVLVVDDSSMTRKMLMKTLRAEVL